MIVENLFLLLAGLGVFMFGVKELSDNMEKLANRRLKTVFQRTSKNPLVGIGLGAAATAIVQSSGLTTVMVVGFVNAGLMTLYQATAFIMGANIGTTITAQIAALDSFQFTNYAIALSFVGMVVTMASKKQKVKSIGFALAGLGFLFIGLTMMSGAMNNIKDQNEAAVQRIFASITNPVLLLLIGVVFTALMQSSAAVTSIIIIMASSGIVVGGGGNSVLYLILGSNIGSCATSLISSIGAGTEAKRASLIHLMFNLFGSLIFFIILICWRNFMDVTFAAWFKNPGQQIAMFHTFFNVVCTVIFLPFIKLFVFLAKFIVRGEKKEADSLIADTFLKVPTVAIEQTNKETIRIADIAFSAMKESFEAFIDRRTDSFDDISAKNAEVNELSRAATDYLIRISSHDLTLNDEKRISILHNNISDIMRLADISDNFVKYTSRAIREDISFSPGVNEDLMDMFATFTHLFELTREARTNRDRSLLSAVDEEEDKLDAARRRLVTEHIDRMNRGECSASSSGIFINLVSNIERAGDHLSFIAHTVEEVAMP